MILSYTIIASYGLVSRYSRHKRHQEQVFHCFLKISFLVSLLYEVRLCYQETAPKLKEPGIKKKDIETIGLLYT